MRQSVIRLGYLLPVVALLAGCATLGHPPGGSSAPSAPPPLPRAVVPTPAAENDLMAQLLAGQFAVNQDNLPAAAAAYAKAAMLSADPAISRRAARLAITTHDLPSAKRLIARWATLGASPAQLALIRARLAMNNGDTDTARKQLLWLVTHGGEDAWRSFGQLLLGARDAAQAGTILKAVATPARLPDDAQAWLAMSELGQKLGQTAYARQLASAALKRFDCADCYAWAAQLAFSGGHRQRARALYATAVRKAPKSKHLRVGYASLLAQLGDNAAAARALAQGPQDAETFQLRAAYAARAGDMPALRRTYDDLRQAPAKVRDHSYYLLGQLAQALKLKTSAERWLQRVPSTSDHRFDADFALALMWQEAGEGAKARARARQMVDEYATDPEHLRKALALEARLALNGHEYASAIAAFNRALALAPGDPDLLYGRGVANAEAGHVDAAVADFEHVLKLKPDNVDALNALGFTLADANRDLPRAGQLLARARQARPHDPTIQDSWGWLQYRLGHLHAAQAALEAAWAADKDPDIGRHLATVLWQRGEVKHAHEVLAAARKLAPHDAQLAALARQMQQ